MSAAGPGAVDVLEGAEIVEPFADWGITAFTTGRAAGSSGSGACAPGRWNTRRWPSTGVGVPCHWTTRRKYSRTYAWG